MHPDGSLQERRAYERANKVPEVLSPSADGGQDSQSLCGVNPWLTPWRREECEQMSRFIGRGRDKWNLNGKGGKDPITIVSR